MVQQTGTKGAGFGNKRRGILELLLRQVGMKGKESGNEL